MRNVEWISFWPCSAGWRSPFTFYTFSMDSSLRRENQLYYACMHARIAARSYVCTRTYQARTEEEYEQSLATLRCCCREGRYLQFNQRRRRRESGRLAVWLKRGRCRHYFCMVNPRMGRLKNKPHLVTSGRNNIHIYTFCTRE